MDNQILQVTLWLLIPFLGTTLGASFVFLLKKQLSSKIEKALLGFAAGVMMAASCWSLLIPSIEMAGEQGKVQWIAPAVGFSLGIITLMIVNKLAEKIEEKNEQKKNKTGSKFEIEKALNQELNKSDKIKEKIKSTTMLVIAVTLHNIPEGMAVGVVFAGLLQGGGITITEAIALAIGIAIQNIPEGAIISMPIRAEGKSKVKSFLYGMLSGIVEPIGAVITIALTNIVVPILPYLLAFAAGSMIYVVANELIPEAQEDKKSNIATIGIMVGFVIMMILDVALG